MKSNTDTILFNFNIEAEGHTLSAQELEAMSIAMAKTFQKYGITMFRIYMYELADTTDMTDEEVQALQDNADPLRLNIKSPSANNEDDVYVMPNASRRLN